MQPLQQASLRHAYDITHAHCISAAQQRRHQGWGTCEQRRWVDKNMLTSSPCAARAQHTRVACARSDQVAWCATAGHAADAVPGHDGPFHSCGDCSIRSGKLDVHQLPYAVIADERYARIAFVCFISLASLQVVPRKTASPLCVANTFTPHLPVSLQTFCHFPNTECSHRPNASA